MTTQLMSMSTPRGLSEADIEDVYNCGIDTGGLDFSGTNLSGDQPYHIAELLSSNKLVSIVHIDLSNSEISTDGFEALLFAAMEVKSLESLVSKGTRLSVPAGLALSKMLSARGNLKILDVSDNNLGDIGVSNLSGVFSADHTKSLQKYSLSVMSLTVLDLSGNNISDAGVLALCRGLSQLVRRVANIGLAPGLKILRLSNNKIGDKGALCLAQLINTYASSASTRNGHNQGSRGISSPTQGSESYLTLRLEELDLSGNPLTVRGITALLTSSEEGTASPLRRLLLNDTLITPAVIEHLGSNIVFCGANGTASGPFQQVSLGVSVERALNLIIGNYEPDPPSTQEVHWTQHEAAVEASLAALCASLRRLSAAVVAYGSNVGIDFGSLHATLYNYCCHVMGTNPNGDACNEVRAIANALEACNYPAMVRVLQTQAVPNVRQWLRSGEYVCDENSAAYKNAAEVSAPEAPVLPAFPQPTVETAAAAEQVSTRAVSTPSPTPAPAQAVSPVPAPVVPSGVSFKSSFLSTFKTTLGENNDLHIGGILGEVAPKCEHAEEGAHGAASKLPSKRVEKKDQKVFLSSLAQTLSSVEEEFRTLTAGAKPAQTAAPPLPTPAPAPADLNPVLSAREEEYNRLRKDRENALHALSSEIDRVAHLSAPVPTATTASRPAPSVAPTPAFAPPPTAPVQDTSEHRVPSPQAVPAPDAEKDTENTVIASAPQPSAAATEEAAKLKDDPSLVQTIGYLQGQMTALAQKQQMYESAFVNKYSNLEYRIEAIEAGLRQNNETLLALQLQGARAPASPVSTPAGPAGIAGSEAKESVPERAASPAAQAAKASAGSFENALAKARASVTSPVKTPALQSPVLSISAVKSHTPSRAPGTPNELLITDLMARLEVVEGRMLQDRATLLQAALNKQMQQERQLQRHDLLERLAESASPKMRSSPQGGLGNTGTGSPFTAPFEHPAQGMMMHGSPFHVQGGYPSGSPVVIHSPVVHGFASPQQLHQLPLQYHVYPGAAPYIPPGYPQSAMHGSPYQTNPYIASAAAGPVSHAPQYASYDATQTHGGFSPYVPGPSPYIPQDVAAPTGRSRNDGPDPQYPEFPRPEELPHTPNPLRQAAAASQLPHREPERTNPAAAAPTAAVEIARDQMSDVTSNNERRDADPRMPGRYYADEYLSASDAASVRSEDSRRSWEQNVMPAQLPFRPALAADRGRQVAHQDGSDFTSGSWKSEKVDRALFPSSHSSRSDISAAAVASLRPKPSEQSNAASAYDRAASSASSLTDPHTQSSRVATFNVKSGTLSTAAQSAKDKLPATKAAASHIDQGYYQYKPDQNFTTGASAVRTQGRESSAAGAIPPGREYATNGRNGNDIAPAQRQMNEHAHLRASLDRERAAEQNTLNYSVINNISRNSISMTTEDPLNDSKDSIAVIRHYQAHLQDRPNRPVTPISADAAHRAENHTAPSRAGGAKTPNFMRQTASNAHKITTGKPHTYGHLGATH